MESKPLVSDAKLSPAFAQAWMKRGLAIIQCRNIVLGLAFVAARVVGSDQKRFWQFPIESPKMLREFLSKIPHHHQPRETLERTAPYCHYFDMTDQRDIILILEDNPARLELMQAEIKVLTGQFEIRQWDSVWKMTTEGSKTFHRACLISLDYNLSESRLRSPGNGMDAVQMLNRHTPFCPVIVHTSLVMEGEKMARALRERGWVVEQAPLKTRESVHQWRIVAEALIGKINHPE
jgi:hypothetical protein